MSIFTNRAHARTYVAMTSLASRMTGFVSGEGPLSRRDPVAYADLVTSMCDQRVALSIAAGTPLESIDRNGYRKVDAPS